MRGMIKLALALLVGCAIGLFTAYQMVAGSYGVVVEHKGPWRVWEAAGTPRVDPYTRAHFLLRGRLPTSHFEAVEFEARTDDEGRMLSGQCIYDITAPRPRARWWSLTAFPEGTRSDPGAAPHSLLASRVVYEPDGAFRAVLSPEARPGNWLRPSGKGDLVLTYRLYNAEPVLRSAPLTGDLPSIRREACL